MCSFGVSVLRGENPEIAPVNTSCNCCLTCLLFDAFWISEYIKCNKVFLTVKALNDYRIKRLFFPIPTQVDTGFFLTLSCCRFPKHYEQWLCYVSGENKLEEKFRVISTKSSLDIRN